MDINHINLTEEQKLQLRKQRFNSSDNLNTIQSIKVKILH
jgi:hypothetical protein